MCFPLSVLLSIHIIEKKKGDYISLILCIVRSIMLIGVDPITQLRSFIIEVVTFKEGHLMW